MLLALVAAAAIRGYVIGAMDLRDVPGMAGPRLISEALLDPDELTPIGVGSAIAALVERGVEPVAAARLLMTASGVVAAAGAALGAWALCGWASATAAAWAAATWSLGVWMAPLVCRDTPAWGLSWLGVGLAWAASRWGWPGLIAGWLGGWLAVVGVAAKAIALPALGFLPLAPLLVRRDPLRAVALAGAVVMGARAGRAAMPLESADPGAALLGTGPDAVREGLALVQGFPAMGHPEGVFTDLAALALAGALIPGARSGWRKVLFAVALIGVSLTAWNAMENNDKVLPRHLIAASYGLVVLAGCALGQAARWLRSLGPLRWAPAVAAIALLSLDALAFLRACDAQRVALLDAAPTTLPAAPAAWARRYAPRASVKFPRAHFDDTTAVGMIEAMALSRDAPPGGLATLEMRDNRDMHLVLGAALAGREAIVLQEEQCCVRGGDRRACARAVLTALNDGGAMFLFPWARESLLADGDRFADAIRVEAKAWRPWTVHEDWITWRGGGDEEIPLPCGPQWEKVR